MKQPEITQMFAQIVDGKRFFLIRLAVGFLFILPLPLSTLTSQNYETIDGVSVIVGNEIIMNSDVIQILQAALAGKDLSNVSENEIISLRSNVLKDLVNQRLLVSASKEDTTILVKDADIERALSSQVSGLILQLGSEERVEKYFGKSIQALKRENWQIMKDNLYAEQYREMLLRGVSITRNDVLEFYSEYKDSLGVIPEKYTIDVVTFPIVAGSKSRGDAYSILSNLRNKILNDEISFEDAAKQLSQDPGSAQNGGELGLVERGVLVPAFEEVAFSLNEGSISDVVATEFGYHIIQLVARQGEKVNVRHILFVPAVDSTDVERSNKRCVSLLDSLNNLSVVPSTLIQSDTPEIASRLDFVGNRVVSQEYFETIGINPNILVETSNVFFGPYRSENEFQLIKLKKYVPGGVVSLEKHWLEIEKLALEKKKFYVLSKFLLEKYSSVYIKIL